MSVPAREFYFETVKSRILQRLNALTQDWSSHENRLRDLAQNFNPRRARWSKGEFNRGEDLNAFIINNAPLIAVRVASSGLLATIANPTREWFRQTVSDDDLAEYPAVRSHLWQRSQNIRAAMAKGTFYQGLADGILPDVLVYGFAAALMIEHPTRYALVQPQMMGEYRIAVNEDDVVDTLYRTIPMTVRQMVRQFALLPGNRVDRSRLSSAVRNLWDRGSYDTVVEAINAIQPNDELEPGRLGWRGMPFVSKWLEKASEDDRWLREAGFNRFPGLCPRWSARTGEAYGRGLGDETVGDAKELQHEERRTGLMLDKIVNPPMVADDRTAGQRHSLVSGDITFEPAGQSAGFRPAHEVQAAALAAAKDHVLRTQDRIDRGFMVDLFIRLLQDTRAQRATATEIEEVANQTALQLGPALERLTPELLQASVEWFDQNLEARGLMPPRPPELEGQDVKVEFISVMHQAQKGVGLGPLRIFVQELSVAAQLKPSVLDKFDEDEYVDQLAEMTGVAPNIVLSDDLVKELRAARAQRQAATDALEAAQAGASAAKDLGTTPAPASGNALGAVLGASTPAQATGATLTPLGPVPLGGFPMGGGNA